MALSTLQCLCQRCCHCLQCLQSCWCLAAARIAGVTTWGTGMVLPLLLWGFGALSLQQQGERISRKFWVPSFYCPPPGGCGSQCSWETRIVGVASSAAAAAKSLQLCPSLCDPIDGSPSGSPVPGILQARTLEWVAISFSNAWKWKVKVKSLSHVQLLSTPWTAAYQAPPSMGLSRQEYWSGVPLPSPLPPLGVPIYPLLDI